MNPWIVILLVMAIIVFVIDHLLRRKKWKDNSKEEKISLIVNMLFAGPYTFLSVLGMLWGIVGGSPQTAFGEVLYNVTLIMGANYFVVAITAVIASFILRKIGKTKASIWINIIAILYIVAVLSINYLVGNLL